MGLVQDMGILSARELCTEISDGVRFRSAWLVDQIDDKLICPMPRKVTSISFTAGESMKPLWQRQSVPPPTDCEASHEILEIFRSKSSNSNAPSFGCSPPFFSGSPPSRAGNPIVRDVEFSHQRRSAVPASSMHGNAITHGAEVVNKRPTPPSPAPIIQTKSGVTKPPTYRANPHLRVEGFECPARAFECTNHEARRRVPAIA